MMPEVMKKACEFAEEAGTTITETNDMDEAFKDADFLYPKSWGPIMVTEDEPDRRGNGRGEHGLARDPREDGVG